MARTRKVVVVREFIDRETRVRVKPSQTPREYEASRAERMIRRGLAVPYAEKRSSDGDL